jgi:hypothetical protein
MSTTTHPVAPEEIMALLDGELPADQAQSASAHLEGCPECRELAASLRGTSQLLSNWTVPPKFVSSEFKSALTEAARSASSAPRPANAFRLVPFFRRHWILTAASSAVATGAFLMFSITAPRLAKTPATHSYGVDKAQSTAQSRSGGLAALSAVDRLSDGTLGKLQERIELEQRSERPYKSWIQNGPMIARSVSLSIIAKDFSTSRASLDSILARYHGYAATLAVSSEQNAARSLQASLRIPAGELNAAVIELKSLGRVQNETQNGEEVTQQHADLVARLKNSRETEQRLQDILLNRTGKVSDVLAVEQEIARVRGEIEQMEAEQKSLEHRVDFATIDLKLSEEYKAQLGSPVPSVSTRFHNAFVSGYSAAAETIIGILLFFAEVGPSLLIWLLILLPIAWLLWRRWRRSVAIASATS